MSNTNHDNTYDLPLIDLIIQSGLAITTAEARRLIVQGAVSLNSQRVTNTKANVTLTDEETTLQVGKHYVVKVKMQPSYFREEKIIQIEKVVSYSVEPLSQG